jgi:hypothetical protein
MPARESVSSLWRLANERARTSPQPTGSSRPATMCGRPGPRCPEVLDCAHTAASFLAARGGTSGRPVAEPVTATGHLGRIRHTPQLGEPVIADTPSASPARNGRRCPTCKLTWRQSRNCLRKCLPDKGRASRTLATPETMEQTFGRIPSGCFRWLGWSRPTPYPLVQRPARCTRSAWTYTLTSSPIAFWTSTDSAWQHAPYMGHPPRQSPVSLGAGSRSAVPASHVHLLRLEFSRRLQLLV